MQESMSLKHEPALEPLHIYEPQTRARLDTLHPHQVEEAEGFGKNRDLAKVIAKMGATKPFPEYLKENKAAFV